MKGSNPSMPVPPYHLTADVACAKGHSYCVNCLSFLLHNCSLEGTATVIETAETQTSQFKSTVINVIHATKIGVVASCARAVAILHLRGMLCDRNSRRASPKTRSQQLLQLLRDMEDMGCH